MREPYSPPSPAPSIDRFSSMSSWGASSACHSSSSSHSPISAVQTGHKHPTGGRDAHGTQDDAGSAGTFDEKELSPRCMADELGSYSKDQSLTAASAMRDIHDSSSSWTDATPLSTKLKAPSRQASVIATDTMPYIQAACEPLADCSVANLATELAEAAPPSGEAEEATAAAQAAQGRAS